MKNKFFFLTCAIVALSSCEKGDLLVEDEKWRDDGGTSELRVTTRANDGEGTETSTPKQNRIYVFKADGTCVRKLSNEADEETMSARLPAGTYGIYAIGGEDLSLFNLPTQGLASTTSVIQLQTGKVMGDLLMSHEQVTLGDGETKNLNLALTHQVVCISGVAIKQVPTTVTSVEVTVSEFYSTIRLDGTNPDSPTEDYTLTLQKQEDGTTWSATPQVIRFASKGKPTIQVVFTTATGTDAFAYTGPEVLTANRRYTIEGTYKDLSTAGLDMTLTADDWDEDQALNFEFDERQVAYHPVAGKLCNGYFVVSVDEQNRKAVLLAKESLEYLAPANGSPAVDWRSALTAPMAALAVPTNQTGSWRLPTTAECAVFSKDTEYVKITFGSSGYSPTYFCEDDGTLYWGISHKKTDGGVEFLSGTSGFQSYVKLRPVFDISY